MAKNMFIKMGIDRKKLDVCGGICSIRRNDGMYEYINLSDKYQHERKNGILYKYDKCECEYGKLGCYLRSKANYNNPNVIKITNICDYCNKRTSETLKCFDYGDITGYFVDNMDFINCYGIVARNVERELLYNLKDNIMKYAVGNNLILIREFVNRLCKWKNSNLVDVWEAFARIEDGSTFVFMVANNIECMWD